jgi:tRNA modification GTPase
MTQTIFALATPPGRGAIAIIRLSGPLTRLALEALGATALKPRMAHLRRLLTASGEVFDEALCLWFPAPASFTGDDCAELHLHGGPAVVAACVEALIAQGLEPAAPGAFSRRAFENGRLDLTQAEAIADLVDAEGEAQRRQALGQLGGALAERYAGFRRDLLAALALLEAEIDFPDEDTPDAVIDRVAPMLAALADDLTRALGDAERGRQVREGYRIALIGDANAGKSTLFNALSGADRAIVTPVAGTTRDVLEAALVIDGYAVTLIDTAGLRATDDAIEAEGVRRAEAQARSADLRLWVCAPGLAGDAVADLVRAGDLVVANKADLGPVSAPEGHAVVTTSVFSHGGLDALRAWLSARLGADLGGADFPVVTRRRHRLRLERALENVRAGAAALAMGPELAAEDLRRAARDLAEVTGEVGVEDILGEVFSTFCIGK